MNRYLFVVSLLIVSFSTTVMAQDSPPTKAEGSNFDHAPNTLLKTEDDTLVVHRRGEGSTPVVIIPGHLIGPGYFDDFVQRNAEVADYHIAIPPGMNGAPAYAWPDSSDDFLSRQWTRRFEEELAEYIRNNINEKPILFVNWYTGLDAALNITRRYPDLLGGLLVISPVRRSPFYRWYKYDERTVATTYDAEAQREVMESRMIGFWKTVPEFVWHSNTLAGSLYSVDPLTGKSVDFSKAKSPFQIQMRYFIEYMMDDLTDEIANLSIPVQVVSNMPNRESLEQQLMARGIDADAGQAMQSWRNQSMADWKAEKNERINLTFIEGSGLMVWKDRPDEFDRIFRELIVQVR